MTTYDEALALGFALGVTITGLVATALWMCRDREQGPMNRNEDWPE
jgi:hypothetical protein